MKITHYNIYNVFALKKKKPKLLLCYFVLSWLITVIISFSFIAISESISLNGISVCTDNICHIELIVPIDYSSFLSKNLEVEIAKENYNIKTLEYKELLWLDDGNTIGQKVNIIIDNFVYENNKVISIILKRKNKNLWKIVWDSLKGGD